MDRYNIIFDDENLLGSANEIARYVKDALNPNSKYYMEDWVELGEELLEELKDHDGYVYVSYHPMGAYYVSDLYMKFGKEFEIVW